MLLGLDARIGAGCVHEREHRKAVAVHQLHDPHAFR